ncbi:MAG: type III-A CRISPR-associated protein Csm2 [Chloroflexota bacterium]
MSLVTFRFSDVKGKAQEDWQRYFQKWGLQTQAPISFEEAALKQILLPANQEQEERSAKLTVEWGDKLGAILVYRGLSTSQIRAIFGEVRQIEAKLKISQLQGTASETKVWNKLRLLIPKMAYRAKKEGDGVKSLASVFEPAINLVLDGEQQKRMERFERFVNFFESILAYHRAYGGK